ncbi:MAG TPA: DUF2752 domain-containing protein [Thermoanaerobaculia bacterium]|nr:DUF2752 domain-containing protein [Thermoanaerobaculia bacterium]
MGIIHTPAGSASAGVDAPLRLVFSAALLAIPIAGILLPTEILERAPTICLIRIVAGIECWGCGMTRAISALLHGDIRRAVDFNPRVLFVFPLLLALWCAALWRLALRPSR